MNRRPLWVLLGLVLLSLPFGWALFERGLHATGGSEFCSGCHVMEPMSYAWSRDVHGGANPNGVSAACVDCHLPWEGPFGHLLAKARTGLHDVWANTFYDLEAIDWRAKLERREEYTYDSGCLKCHDRLKTAPMRSNKAVVAHRPYFVGQSEKTCVNCHPHVGHQDLAQLFQPAPSEAP